MAGTTGLEPATSAVTGQRSNQLSYVPKIVFQQFGLRCLKPSVFFGSIGSKHSPLFESFRVFLDTGRTLDSNNAATPLA